MRRLRAPMPTSHVGSVLDSHRSIELQTPLLRSVQAPFHGPFYETRETDFLRDADHGRLEDGF